MLCPCFPIRSVVNDQTVKAEVTTNYTSFRDAGCIVDAPGVNSPYAYCKGEVKRIHYALYQCVSPVQVRCYIGPFHPQGSTFEESNSN